MENAVLSRNILLMDAAANTAKKCLSRSLELVFLKGAALLELGVFKYSEREMTDVDVLIRKRDACLLSEILFSLGFKEMDNSSSAFVKSENPAFPPVIIDIHTELRHLKNIEEFFKDAYSPDAASPGALAPCAEDLFLHLVCHALLHHGCFGKRAKTDSERFVKWSAGHGSLEVFMEKLALKTEKHGLKPILYPVLRELFAESEFSVFRPKGLGAVKEKFFRKALKKRSRFMEYFLPALHRPALALKYLFPEKEFLTRRYGRQSAWNAAMRPFRLLKNIFKD